MHDDRQTILLVEDTVELATVVTRELAAAGYRVVGAANGRAAIAMHTEAAPDLIVLDWMLPGLSGIDVLRQIRQSAATPILMLTARGEEADRVIGLELGADDYLPKPFSMRELIARVRALLRRDELLRQSLRADQAPGDAAIAHGPLALDPGHRTAHLAGDLVDLTPHEFDLLALLARHPGRAFSRSYLLDTVWGQEFITGDRAVDNTVFRLRKKLGDFGDEIEAVWGVGYRLRAGASAR